MLLFWTLAALISSGAALIMLTRASQAERGGAADPTADVYRRQLAEIDELAERGLLGPEERKAARAEAGRRLLGEADRGPAPAPALHPGAARRWVMAAAVAAPLLALVGYLLTGAPGFPDQPFKARLKSWQAISRTDPARLRPQELAAVFEAIVADHPRDPQARFFLAAIERGEGDLPGAARDLQKAAALQPDSAKIWTLLGVVLTEANQGQIGDDARAAFRRAAALDPSAVEARYFLARADIVAGRADAGLAAWRALLASLPTGDPRRATLAAEIAETTRTGRLPAAEAQASAAAAASAGPGEPGQEAAFIQSMVERLAARLQTQPNDPEGWARLIRAYGVLHQDDKRAAAVAQAQRLFKDRPDALKTALAGAAAPPIGGR